MGGRACILQPPLPLCQTSLVLQQLTDSGRSSANTKGLGFSLHSSDICHDQGTGIPDQWLGQSLPLNETVSDRDIAKLWTMFLALLSQKVRHSTGAGTAPSKMGLLWLLRHMDVLSLLGMTLEHTHSQF